MGARCTSCGESVMTYRRYLFWMRPTARCDGCGARVRLHGFWWLAGVAVVALVAGAAWGVSGVGFSTNTVYALLGVGAAFAVLDYGSYRYLSWSPVTARAPESEPTSVDPSDA